MKLKAQHNSIGYLLIQISKIRKSKTNQLLAQTGIHAGQDILLYYLSLDNGQTVSSLVNKMIIRYATIFNMIDRMEASGLVKKEKDPVDKRVSRVYLTDKGKKAVSVVGDVWKEIEALSVKGFSKEQENMLCGLLQNVHNNLGA